MYLDVLLIYIYIIVVVGEKNGARSPHGHGSTVFRDHIMDMYERTHYDDIAAAVVPV